MSKILVLNMGMKSIRSIIFDSEGNKLAASSVPITTALKEECVTQNPEEWWEKACKVIRDTLDDIDSKDIDFVTVTSSSACLLAVDEEGNALTQCMMVSDKRAMTQSDKIKQYDEYHEVYERTGIEMDSYMMLPKALWIKENEPEIYEKTYKLLSPNDFLIAKLSGGTFVTDYINAGKWQYDLKTGKYPEELLKRVGLDLKKLPDVMNPGEYVAAVSPNASIETGLSETTKIVITTYDAICSFIGSGALKPGQACDITGTVTVFRTVADHNASDRPVKIQSQYYREADIHILGGSNNMGGGLIEWVKQCYYQNEELPYELMEKDAREVGVGAGGLIFLPYLLGERAPVWDYDARGVFFGLERTHTRKEMTRAVFESTGFIDLDMMAAIEKNGGRVDSIRLSGGLARVPLISQIKADITGKEIEVLDEFETTASGAAMIALFGQKIFSCLSEAAEVFSRVRMVIKPNMRANQKYSEMYRLYKKTYETLKPLFPERMRIVTGIMEDRRIRIENL